MTITNRDVWLVFGVIIVMVGIVIVYWSDIPAALDIQAAAAAITHCANTGGCYLV